MFKRIILGGLLLLPVAAGGGLLWLKGELEEPTRSPHSSVVVIPRGSSVARVAEVLQAAGVIRSSFLFEWYVRYRFDPPLLKAGEYRFESPLSLSQVAERIHRGEVLLHHITIPEGLDRRETIDLLEALGWGRRQLWERAVQNPSLVRDLDPQASHLEGYLFPETYAVARPLREEAFVAQMVEHFRRIWTPRRQARARELGLSTRQLVTLASLIEKETSVDSERPLVSAVFHNRLARGMKLECDPTVIYAVKEIKPFDGIIHRSDLQLDHPYNTYRYAGLPPGPIASPGLASIDAALYPAAVDYLYFVADNRGGHVFSTNYLDHSRAVQEFQR